LSVLVALFNLCLFTIQYDNLNIQLEDLKADKAHPNAFVVFWRRFWMYSTRLSATRSVWRLSLC